jgi:hypothetical protein
MSSEMRENDRPNYERANFIQVELNTSRSLKSQSAAYPATFVPAPKLLSISGPLLMSHRTYCISFDDT